MPVLESRVGHAQRVGAGQHARGDDQRRWDGDRCVRRRSTRRVGVLVLERANFEASVLKRCDSLDRGLRPRHRGANGSRISSAVRRIENESAVPHASGVLITIAIFSSRIRSTTCGDPCATLFTMAHEIPRPSICRAVPPVATNSKPIVESPRTIGSSSGLSSSRTLMNTHPLAGRSVEAASSALANAIANVQSIPITSPVDFISGPRMVSTPGKRTKGNTDSLTETWSGTRSAVKPRSVSFLPAITSAASLASGTPIALLTNGMVREARGLTSRM